MLIYALTEPRQLVVHWAVVDPDDIQAQQSAAQACLIKALSDNGMNKPMTVYSDNGAPFYKLDRNADQYSSVSLQFVKAKSGQPRGTGAIEKLAQSALHNHIRLLPGYVGTDLRAASDNPSTWLSREQLIRYLEEFVRQWNASRGKEVDGLTS